jgi:hypothetical protein
MVDPDSKAGSRPRRASVVVPNKDVQHLLSERAILKREIALRQKKLAALNGRLRAAGFAVRDDLPSIHENARPFAFVQRMGLIDAIEKIANESSRPVSKAELRRRLLAMGMPQDKFNNYFYQAIRRLRSRERISVFDDGSIWRP